MKKLRIVLAVSLILAIACSIFLTGCKKTAATSEGDKIIATVNGHPIYNRDFLLSYNYYISMYQQNGYTIDESTEEGKAQVANIKSGVMDELIRVEIARELAVKAGYYKFTDSEKATLKKNFDAKVEENIQQLMENDASNYPEASQAALRKQATTEFWKQMGMTSDQAFQTVLVQTAIDKHKKAFDTKATIDQAYNAVLNNQKTTYTNSDSGASSYESDVTNGEIVLYNLTDYIRVKHILLKLGDTDSNTIKTWRNDTYKEDGSVDKTKAAEVDKKRDALVKKALGNKANTVLGLVQAKGADFNALLAKYGGDPGMSTEGDSKTNGYLLSPKSSFVAEFLTAAFKLKNVGDTSGLVISDYGYHIIKLVAKITPGPVKLSALTDIQKTAVLTKNNSLAYEKAVDAAVAKAKVVKK